MGIPGNCGLNPSGIHSQNPRFDLQRVNNSGIIRPESRIRISSTISWDMVKNPETTGLNPSGIYIQNPKFESQRVNNSGITRPESQNFKSCRNPASKNAE